MKLDKTETDLLILLAFLVLCIVWALADRWHHKRRRDRIEDRINWSQQPKPLIGRKETTR